MKAHDYEHWLKMPHMTKGNEGDIEDEKFQLLKMTSYIYGANLLI